MNTEQERAEFEAWCLRHVPALLTHVWADNPDRYVSDYTQTAWEAWQAGRAALQSQKPEPNNQMLSGVIRMPFEMAMADPVSRMQFYQRAQQALNELEVLQSLDRDDAERYRWLRDGGNDDMGVVRGFDCIDCGSTAVAGTYEEGLEGEQLDAAIDHARRIEGSA